MRNESARPLGCSQEERATRSTKPCEPHSTAPHHRTSPRDLRRLALAEAMGAAS